MANKYCYSGAAGAGTGADWANAYTTLGAAASGAAAGDDIWVASDHAETAASAKSISFTGNAANPQRCVSVNRAGSVPPVAADVLAGASVTTTGANGISIQGNAYVFGITFNCGTGSSFATFSISGSGFIRYENCAFNLVHTNAFGTTLPSGGSTAGSDLNNCTFSFGNVGQKISLGGAGPFTWRNKPGSVAVTGATIPTELLTPHSNNNTCPVYLSGLDLSALGSGKSLVTSTATKTTLVNCKLDASVTITTAPNFNYGGGVFLIGCSSAGNVSRNEIYHYFGTLTTSTTIMRTAGASDGVTAVSWKIVTTANARRTFPFESFEGAVWNDTTGAAKTLTIHTVTDNVTLTDAEIWVEVEYLGSSGAPVTTTIADCNATVLTTPANQTSDSGEAWTTTGLTTPVKQKLEVTFTPQMAGLIRWKVKVAKASTTVYVCPKPEVA